MRKLLSLLLVLVMMSSLFIGCAKNDPAVEKTTEVVTTTAAETTATEATASGAYADGIYFTTGSGFDLESGWKEVLTLEVKDGNIVSVDWNGASVNAGKDKKTTSKDGEYNMVAYGKAISEWDVQAALVEAYLVENQTFENVNLTDADGHTDSITGVSIKVMDFQTLVEQALAAGPVGTGKYVDGSFFAEQAAFAADSGWKDNASFTVINGFIVAANWNGTTKDGVKDKKATSIDGEYNMVKFGKAQSEWDVQVGLVEGFITDAQDLSLITLSSDGKTDAVAGVSINVSVFVELAEQALKLR